MPDAKVVTVPGIQGLIPVTIGERVRQVREARGLNRDKTAIGVGISIGYLSDIEVMHRPAKPSRQLTARLAVFLETTENYLRYGWRTPGESNDA